MKQSTAWVVSFFASGAIFAALLAILFAAAGERLPVHSPMAAGSRALSGDTLTPSDTLSPSETLTPADAPLTLSPDEP